MNHRSSISKHNSKSAPKWIDTPGQLNQLINVLSQESLVAVDTESDSLYSYFEKVCLIQFSTPQEDFLVDPLSVDISSLDSFFANSSIQKIFHAAEYDFLSLKRDYGFSFSNLFDTMLAARILGWKRYGLGSLLKDHFGVTLDKRFQRYNWGKRPLSHKALTYAHLDTHYLIPLRKIQYEELEKQNRLLEATEAFERLTQVEPTVKNFDPDDFWRIKGAKHLVAKQQSVLRELFILRDGIARRLDLPPFKIINNSILLELVKAQPLTTTELRQVKGLREKLVQRNGKAIIKAIKKGQKAAPPRRPPNNHHPDNDTLTRYEALRQWRNGVAAERGVEPDVIINNHTLMDIARHNPKTLNKLNQIDLLGDWQCKTYGKRLLQLLRTL